MTKSDDLPKKSGVLNIYPEMVFDNESIKATIVGDSEGLNYLADLLIWLSEIDQDTCDIPIREREHLHLDRKFELGASSCRVEICRADAKGTGKVPDFMRY